MVGANFANFANFGGVDRQKLAKLAKLAPTDKVSWGSGTGGPAVSITSKKRRAPKAELDSLSGKGPVPCRPQRHQWQPNSTTAQAIEGTVAKILSDPAQAKLAEHQMSNK